MIGQLRVRGLNEGPAEQESPFLGRPSWLNNREFEAGIQKQFSSLLLALC